MTTDNSMKDGAFDLLRAELNGVSAPRDFANRVMARIGEQAAEPLGDVDVLSQELASLDVSPAFAARVRQQIEDAPARFTWFGLMNRRWAMPSALLAAAAVVLLVLLLRPVGPGSVAEPTDTVVASSGSVIAPPSIPPAVTTQPSENRPNPVHTAAVTHQPEVARPVSSDPMDEVITSQPAILRRLWAANGPVRELVESNEVARPVASGEIVFAPIEVNPIVVKSLIDPDGTPSGSSPIIRRVAADQAERSPK